MVVDPKAGRLRGAGHRGRDRTLEAGRRGHVLDEPAARAHEMVMMAAERLAELVAGELVVRDHPAYDAGLLEHDEVAVQRALRKVRALIADLGHRQRSFASGEQLDDRRPLLRQPETSRREMRGRCSAPVFGRRGTHPPSVTAADRSPTGAVSMMAFSLALYGDGVDPTARFVALVGDATTEPPLDEAALLIAQHVHPALDLGFWTARLDDLAAACPEPTFDGVRHHLFAVERFRGNTKRYDDPANSLLDVVLERRLGIPISLAVVMLEVARRTGVRAVGIGMPGHFLVGDPERRGRYCDVFSGGVLLDEDECSAIFARAVGPAVAFDPSMLAPTGARAIIARMLANLERSSLAGDPVHATWMATLHFAIVGLPIVERVAVARRLGRLGRLTVAADELDALAALVSDVPAARLRDEARALRARLN
jgi:regulator of sirC expression with transglutaminase-like and TPR domain